MLAFEAADHEVGTGRTHRAEDQAADPFLEFADVVHEHLHVRKTGAVGAAHDSSVLSCSVQRSMRSAVRWLSLFSSMGSPTKRPSWRTMELSKV